MKQAKAEQILSNFDLYVNHDRIFLNNPVMLQGLGLAPLLVMDTTCHLALMLAVAVTLLLIPTRLLGSLLLRRLKNPVLRAIFFCVISCSLYALLVYPVMNRLFSTQLLKLGIYLPLLTAEPLIIYRHGTHPEPLSRAWTKSLSVTAGYLLVLFLFGALRELLTLGSLFGAPLLPAGLLPIAAQPAGGLLLLGVMCAIWRGAITVRKKRLITEAKHSI